MDRLILNGRKIDLQCGSVRDDSGYSTTLRPQTVEVLKVLAAKPGKIVSKDELMQAVWKDITVSDDSLVQCVIEIRKALGDGKHQVVRTLPKRGYVLEPQAIDDTTGATKDRKPTSGVLPTYRRGSWISLAAGLSLVIAAAANFWPVRQSDADHSAMPVQPLENISVGTAGEQPDMTALESAKVTSLEKELLAARSEADALRKSAQVGNTAREEARRREREARQELAAYRAVQMRTAANAKAVQRQALDEQQRAERLAGNLGLAWRKVERLEAEAIEARRAEESLLAEAERALDGERQKVGLLERDLDVARQSIYALEASAKVTAAARAADTQRRQALEASLAATTQKLTEARRKSGLLEGDLVAARGSIEELQTKVEQAATEQTTTVSNRQPVKVSLAEMSASVPTPAPRASRREIRKDKSRKLPRPARQETVMLPTELLPTRR